MEQATPIALKRDAIFETLFEIRFDQRTASMEELLPGVLFSSLKHLFGDLTPLPLAQIPKAVRGKEFAYQPVHALTGKNLRLMLGAKVATLSFSGNYLGWAKAKPIIMECVNAVLKTGLVGEIERCSLKYVNALAVGTSASDLGQLTVDFRLNGFALRGAGTQLRAEIDIGDLIAIVEIQTDVTITPPADSGKKGETGVMLAVDVIREGPLPAFAEKFEAILEHLHATEKGIFFNLLTRQTLEKLGPIWS